MDVMEPTLVWLEGVCYRFTDSDIWMPKDNAIIPEMIGIDPQKCGDVEMTMQQDITKSDANDICKHSFYVARRYYPLIVGNRKTRLIQIETETKAKICMPQKFDKNECVMITGANNAVIEDAMDRIKAEIDYARTIIDPTHFLYIPITGEAINSNFAKFKDDVLKECDSNVGGINETVFEDPEKLRLNLGMLLLVDDYEIKAALEGLAELKETIITPLIKKNGPIMIKVEKLDCVQEVHSLTNVVYAKVLSENNTLQVLADRTEQFFVKKGLMIVPKQRMNLRIKLMSFPSVVGKEISCRNAHKSCHDFMTTHKDHFFGETVLSSIYLSHRHIHNKNERHSTIMKIDLQDL